MHVNRSQLLSALESVSPGLAKREILEQSSCFCFGGNIVQTFNEEICCTAAIPCTLTGAVAAGPLLSQLGKWPEPEIDISTKNGQLILKGKGRRAGIRMEAEVLLPVDLVEQPGKWHPLPPEFAEAVGLAVACAATTDDAFNLTCVHVAPGWVEACDNYQILRYTIRTGGKQPWLMRREAAKHIPALGMTEISLTPGWAHYRNAGGLVLSCRRYLDDYGDLTNLFDVPDAQPAALPGGLAEAVANAKDFAQEGTEYDQVRVIIRPDLLHLRGEGAMGFYEQRIRTAYNGPPLEFCIGPALLTEIAKRHKEVLLSPDKLKVDGGKWQYVACLILPDVATVAVVANAETGEA